MKFNPTSLPGVTIIELSPLVDERGLFARTFDDKIFAEHGMPTHWPQCNVSYSPKLHTLRGMHFQADPKPEPKLIRCTRGRVYDVAVDLRPASPTFKGWTAVELSSERRNMFYIPAGLAHGFLTLEEGSELFYQMGESYDGKLARGVRWNDPAFGIEWPFQPQVMHERDTAFPDFVA